MKRTQDEVTKEIDTLQAMLPNVRHFTTFGDDNHEAIEAQIQLLELELEYDETFDWEENGDFSEHASGAARDAALWRDGDEDEAPSAGWAPLVKGNN